MLNWVGINLKCIGNYPAQKQANDSKLDRADSYSKHWIVSIYTVPLFGAKVQSNIWRYMKLKNGNNSVLMIYHLMNLTVKCFEYSLSGLLLQNCISLRVDATSLILVKFTSWSFVNVSLPSWANVMSKKRAKIYLMKEITLASQLGLKILILIKNNEKIKPYKYYTML